MAGTCFSPSFHATIAYPGQLQPALRGQLKRSGLVLLLSRMIEVLALLLWWVSAGPLRVYPLASAALASGSVCLELRPLPCAHADV